MRDFMRLFLCAALLLITPVFDAAAHEDDKIALTVENAWARETGKRTVSAAVYLTLENSGHDPIHIIGASSPAAERVEIHRSMEEDGIMRMSRHERVTIGPEEAFHFAPGDFHLMLFKLKEPLKKGDIFPVELALEGQDPISIYVSVTGIAGPDN